MILASLFLFAAVLVGMGLIHYYLWRKLVRATTHAGGRARRTGTWVSVGMYVLAVVTFADRVLPYEVGRVLSWPGYVWVAIMFYLVLGLVLLELPALVVRTAMRRRAVAALPRDAVPAAVPAGPGYEVPGPTTAAARAAGHEGAATNADGIAADGVAADGITAGRRLFLARTVAVVAGVAAGGLVGIGVPAAVRPPRIKRVGIPLARLRPVSGRNTRIAVVSDIHLGPMRGAEQTRRIVELINGLDPDAVAVVGDLVDGTVEELTPAVAPLAGLRGRYGAYFVTGNHEYYAGYEQWVRELPNYGLTLLRNERVELPVGLDLAGVNDIGGSAFGDGPDLDAALAGRDESRPVVLLAHQPVFAHEAARRGIDLQLSGHTHGGQMVPINLLVRATGQPMLSGLGRVDGMPIYVSNGAGFWGPPVRIGAPPEIALVELLPGT